MKNNLKKYRQHAGLTLKELSRLCYSSTARLCELEKDGNPTLFNAYAIAKVLNKSVYDIWPDETEIVEETIVIRRIKKAPKK